MSTVIWLLLFMLAISNAAVAGDSSNLTCVERMELPSYPPIAKQARISGTVNVDVVLSPIAAVQSLNFRTDPHHSIGPIRVLERAVADAMRAARFNRGCEAKTVTLVFIFELGEATIETTETPGQTVAFGSPNRFWIRSAAPHWQP